MASRHRPSRSSLRMRRGALLSALLAVACTATGRARPSPGSEIRRLDAGFTVGAMIVGDFDGDGDTDLVVGGDDRVRLLLGDGKGGLDPTLPVGAGANVSDLAAGDIDEDGLLDLVVANHETDYVTVLLGSGDGFLHERTARIPVGVDPHPHAVALADLDADGSLDLLVDDRAAGAIRLFRGHGDGNLVGAPPIDVGGDPYRGFVVIDLDLDGDLDLVTPNPRAVRITLNDGTGRFSSGGELTHAGLSPFTVVAGDIDGDGVADVGAGSGETDGVFVAWLGTGDGTFTLDPGSPYRLARGPTSAISADIDGDGLQEFLVTAWNGEAVWTLGGDAGWASLEFGALVWDVAAADLDGDGAAELVTADDRGPTILVMPGVR